MDRVGEGVAVGDGMSFEGVVPDKCVGVVDMEVAQERLEGLAEIFAVPAQPADAHDHAGAVREDPAVSRGQETCVQFRDVGDPRCGFTRHGDLDGRGEVPLPALPGQVEAFAGHGVDAVCAEHEAAAKPALFRAHVTLGGTADDFVMVEDSRPGRQCPVQQKRVEAGAAHEVEWIGQPVPDQRMTAEMERETAGDGVHDSFADEAIGGAAVQPLQQAHALPGQKAAAELGARERGLFQHEGVETPPGQDQGRGAARGPGPGDDHVGMVHVPGVLGGISPRRWPSCRCRPRLRGP
ncbi:hypothetical protein DSECCO2_507280 [anaerobic digester metagenome]